MSGNLAVKGSENGEELVGSATWGLGVGGRGCQEETLPRGGEGQGQVPLSQREGIPKGTSLSGRPRSTCGDGRGKRECSSPQTGQVTSAHARMKTQLRDSRDPGFRFL